MSPRRTGGTGGTAGTGGTRRAARAAAARTAYTSAWAQRVRLGVDRATARTWDPGLARPKRVLVPVDVQAFVAVSGGERLVPVGGVLEDPDPFPTPTEPGLGVHLHWALPDSLLRGRHDEEAQRLVLPPLPDRWVVVRVLCPRGGGVAHTTGWVIDAGTGALAPLEGYAGGPLGAGADRLVPLDGAARRTLLWSATYTGAQGRFTLHDPLDDLPGLAKAAPQGFDADRAAYVVAGWWADAEDDPLADVGLLRGLDEVTRELGWRVSRDSGDAAEAGPDERTARADDRLGKDSGDAERSVTVITQYAETTVSHAAVAPAGSLAVSDIAKAYLGRAAPTHLCLAHGSVVGVPLHGLGGKTDDRPDPDTVGAALGLDIDDVAAAFAAPGLAAGERATSERLLAAFTSGHLARIDTPDGILDVLEHEHAEGFTSVPGAPIPGAVPDRLRESDSLPVHPGTVGRKGRGARTALPVVELAWAEGGVVGLAATRSRPTTTTGPRAAAATGTTGTADAAGARATSDHVRPSATTTRPAAAAAAASAARRPDGIRSVVRAAPRMFRPAAPLLGLRGVRTAARHHRDGSFDSSGRLVCRRPAEVVRRLLGVVEGALLVPTLGAGAIPPEVTDLVRETLLLDGYHARWLAEAGWGDPDRARAAQQRIVAEMVRLYGTSAAYDGTGAGAIADLGAGSGGHRAPRASGVGAGWAAMPSATEAQLAAQVVAELADYSYLEGMPPSPLAITAWRQPWVPLFLDWEVEVTGRDDLVGWSLGDLDLEPADGAAPTPTIRRTLTGRAPLTPGVGTALTQALRGWLEEEERRDSAVPPESELTEAEERDLGVVRDRLAPLDVVGASLDGLREQLLDLDYRGGFVRRTKDAPDAAGLPTAGPDPVPLFGGTVQVTRLLLVDAFGRTLPVSVDDIPTTTTLEVSGTPSTIRVAPRVLHGARWLCRLVDPAYDLAGDPVLAPEAWVDQGDPAGGVSPVCGFLLPDHIDEACEVFDRDGAPIGQLMHDSVTDAVTWEPAPGRPVPPSAGPLEGTPPHAQHIGLLAAGLVRADIEARGGRPRAPVAATAEASALTALLRAIDSTLWGVDTYAALGSPTIAGLVGRPVAVVRAVLRLDAPDDLAEVRLDPPGGEGARRAAFDALAAQRFPVRIGDLGRADDSVLGFFVDDDYARFHVVDKVVASVARDVGRHRGQLGVLGTVSAPAVRPLDHPYLELEDTLLVRRGQAVRLTILLLPGGRAHITSGITPRKELALADDWVTPGLRRLVPSVRVGPLLVDPAEIRLPKVASLGEDQAFTRRTGPLTWRDDPIVAATTAALLPRVPHEAQEGWIRVVPREPQGGAP